MKRLVLLAVIALVSFGCSGQEQPAKGNQQSQVKTDENLANQPKISWDVKKETDENGNVIRYDSTYTWSYSSTNGDSMVVNVDSVMQSFHSYFNTRLPLIWERSLTQPLWRDSLFYRDFYRDDYFYRRWQQDFFKMDDMFKQMDSLRNQFFHDQYPGLLMPPPTEGKKKS